MFGCRTASAIVALLGLSLALASCGNPPPDYEVRGARFLARGEAANDTVYDIVAYPLDERELDFFLSRLDAFLIAAGADAHSWLSVQSEIRPTKAMRQRPVWDATGIRCEDFMAAYAKMDFLSGYYSSEPMTSAELGERIQRLELSARAKSDEELDLALQQMRQLARIAPVYGPEQRAFYDKNKVRIEQALDRFRSIGDHQDEPQTP